MPGVIERIHLTVGDATYPLAPLETVKDLENQVVEASRAGGGFLRVTADGGERLSIFVSSSSSIVIASSTLTLDHVDADGPRAAPFPRHPIEYDGDAPYDYI